MSEKTITPELKEVIIGEYKYLVADIRPKLNEPYINMFVVDRERSVQTHTHIRNIINHKKDYRWRFCYKIIESNDPKLTLIPVSTLVVEGVVKITK